MYIIISRHPAAIEFIRANDARFLAAPVITGNATPDDAFVMFRCDTREDAILAMEEE